MYTKSQYEKASGLSSGNLPEPSGPAVKRITSNKLPVSLPVAFRNLPELQGNDKCNFVGAKAFRKVFRKPSGTFRNTSQMNIACKWSNFYETLLTQ